MGGALAAGDVIGAAFPRGNELPPASLEVVPVVVSPLDFDTCRAFLRAWLRANPDVQQKAVAADLGRSPSWMSQVLRGTREIPPSMASAVASALRLGEEDARAFGALVDLESPTLAVRRRAETWLSATRTLRAAKFPDPRIENLYACWYYGAILELARCDGFVGEPGWVASHLRPTVALDDVSRALDELDGMGLLTRDDGGRLVTNTTIIATRPEIPSGSLSRLVARWHESGLSRAAESIGTTKARDRHHGSVMFGLSDGAVRELRRRLGEIEREIVAWSETRPDPIDRVYQLVVALFPVTEPTSTSDDRPR